jgi:hypothetical protein
VSDPWVGGYEPADCCLEVVGRRTVALVIAVGVDVAEERKGLAWWRSTPTAEYWRVVVD